MTTCKPYCEIALTNATSPATSWLSQGIEVLIHDLSNESQRDEFEFDFDVVVVGSGYGGAVAAAELAGAEELDSQGARRSISVCVLERGAEYLPGMFPSRMAEMAGHVRFSTPDQAAPRGKRDGLFDLRVGPHLCALVANGLGGGSLINAGVMERPDRVVFSNGWPAVIRDLGLADHDALYKEAEKLLGTQRIDATPSGNAIPSVQLPRKFKALGSLVKNPEDGHFRSAAVTVALHAVPSSTPDDAGLNAAGVQMATCKRCGDCATGCNHGAKNSLDINLLVKARLAGAHIYTGATVLRLSSKPGGWNLHVNYTDEKLRRRQPTPLALRARRVILAAGSFGSTEILLRSRTAELEFSSKLGQRFSSNGDLIAVAYRQSMEVNAAADETQGPEDREIGPTITGMIDRRSDNLEDSLVIEEMAIPGPLQRIFEETITTTAALHDLVDRDRTEHQDGQPEHDPFAVSAEAVRSTSIFAVMGHDGADGVLQLIGDRNSAVNGDSAASVVWNELPNRKLFDHEVQTLESLCRSGLSPGGHVLPNPMWRPLPKRMEGLIRGQRGPLLTVHPLGGCAMADDSEGGVVDHCGRVYRLDPADLRATHEGLHVLDGAIIPTSLGINPALTIAALSLRAVRSLRDAWGWESPATPNPLLPTRIERPRFRSLEPFAPKPTTIKIIERLVGSAHLENDKGEIDEKDLELTLNFCQKSVRELIQPKQPNGRKLSVESGTIRVYDKGTQEKLPLRASEKTRNDLAEEVADIGRNSTLEVFARVASSLAHRRRRALAAWWKNRGARDLWQLIMGAGGGTSSGISNLLPGLLALASRAGEIRTLEYRLTIVNPRLPEGANETDSVKYLRSERIVARKRLTYAHRSNPWRQLSEVELVEFPSASPRKPNGRLLLDASHFVYAELPAPLLRIVEQQDQPTAMVDIASLGLYLLRMVLHIHMWSFRAPDKPSPLDPQRLPGRMEGLPNPEITELNVGSNTMPAVARLTRYASSKPPRKPVVLIHGYSASGTTFAHPSVRPNLAEKLFDAGHDVWILDLRTSCGLPTSSRAWSFEDVARADIPLAIDHVVSVTGGTPIDVVAHCMGAAMLTLALLDKPEPGSAFFRQRDALPRLIRKAVLSQVGPAVVMSPANIFRGYVMQYLRYFLPISAYEFRPSEDADLVDQLLDRILATLPYPESEWDIENPPWYKFWKTVGFAGTRHRMDALFGRVFNAGNMTPEVLSRIDDLFGRINLETVAQPIHFASDRRVTRRTGDVEHFYETQTMHLGFDFPVLSLHAEDNGLADFRTMAELGGLFRSHNMTNLSQTELRRTGHQDSLIGVSTKTTPAFEAIVKFLGCGGEQ